MMRPLSGVFGDRIRHPSGEEGTYQQSGKRDQNWSGGNRWPTERGGEEAAGANQ